LKLLYLFQTTQHMKAIVVQQFGGPEVLSLQETDTPTPGTGQVLVKVEAAALNWFDLQRRRHDPAYPFPTQLPFTPGGEAAGVVAALGPDVQGPAVGTPVFATTLDAAGAYAQYALADARQVFPIPPGLDAAQAASLVIAGVPAVLILKETVRLKPGETVLIPAAAGGVGSYLVQLAKLYGAGKVIAATSSVAKGEVAKRLGATHTVNYTQPDWAQQVRDLTDGRGVDVLLEMTGSEVFQQGMTALAPFARVALYGNNSRVDTALRTQLLMGLNASIGAFNLGLHFGLKPELAGQAVQELIGLVLQGEVQVHIGHRLPLAQAEQAHRLLETRQNVGKVILEPWS
jgi:NADPH2:quinone reductase